MIWWSIASSRGSYTMLSISDNLHVELIKNLESTVLIDVSICTCSNALTRKLHDHDNEPRKSNRN